MTDRIEFYMPDVDYSNKYNAPKKLWHSWGLDARAVFNRMYDLMSDYKLVGFPKVIDPKINDTIAYNSACLAAESVEHLAGY